MNKKSTKNIKIAFFLNLFFSLVELIGGIFTNSVSILSDSVHDLGDSLSIGISLILEKKSEQKPNKKYTYGYLRFSILGAFITCLVLLVGSIFMIYNAINRLLHPVLINYEGVFILAIIGVLVNGLGTFFTSHGDGLNEKVVSLHLLEDVLGWLAILIASIFMKIFNLPILDPILSICITIFILFHVFKNIKSVFEIFLEKAPNDIDIETFKESLLKGNSSIKDIHHIHLWSADGFNKYLTMHTVVDCSLSNTEIIGIKDYIKHELAHKEINHITIEIEYDCENCCNKNCSVEKHEHNHHHH